MKMKRVIEINNLSVANRIVNLTETIFAGEQIHLLGANGAGKSTLLAALSGFLDFDGQVLINNQDINVYSVQELGRQRAYLPQMINSLPILKVFQYLDLFLPSTSRSFDSLSVNIVDSLCLDFQLTPLLHKSINQLSGGEWQRVRIVAVFLQVWDSNQLCGKFILFDEPTNNLDIIQQANLDKWIKYFCHCLGTVIMSGHNLSHTYKNASRIWMIKKGLMVASGKPDDVMTDSNLSDIFMSEIRLSESSANKIWQIISFDD